MEIYNRLQSEFHIEYGNTAIIGFQQVLTDEEKVFMWVRGSVNRENDRHKTAKEVNNVYRRVEWAKSVWLIDKVIEHFGNQLRAIGITKEHLENLKFDDKSDKWETNNDGYRNFVKAIVMNPISEKTDEPLNIQITQQTKTPHEIYKRAYEESFGEPSRFRTLFNKYRDRAIVRTYTNTYTSNNGLIVPAKTLREVGFKKSSGVLTPVYETNEIVLGIPKHIFINYIVEDDMPEETLDEVVRELEMYNDEEVMDAVKQEVQRVEQVLSGADEKEL